MLQLSRLDVRSGRYRTLLYRFLTDNLPVVDACIWTWSRLAAAPGRYEVVDSVGEPLESQPAQESLAQLADNLGLSYGGRRHGLRPFLVELFRGLFRDGVYGGFVAVTADGSAVDCFVPIDVADLRLQEDADPPRLILDRADGELRLDRPDYYQLNLGDNLTSPLGRSVLTSIPFVSFIEQQLIDDMRRSSHNSGFHRLHVKIAPPERMAGESDKAYLDRINGYFDATVSMIKTCEVDDNPVTWDNVAIDYIGPENTKAVTTNWFMNHRAMVEEICAGTHLAPFLLGYSYGDTRAWGEFKFDMVMRQVTTVQAEAAGFLEWLGDIQLALGGVAARCRFRFDNSLAYQASDISTLRQQRVDSLLKLYQAGLVDESTARAKAGELL
jgi:hypothetical protein